MERGLMFLHDSRNVVRQSSAMHKLSLPRRVSRAVLPGCFELPVICVAVVDRWSKNAIGVPPVQIRVVAFSCTRKRRSNGEKEATPRSPHQLKKACRILEFEPGYRVGG